jgi:hypothetical protein
MAAGLEIRPPLMVLLASWPLLRMGVFTHLPENFRALICGSLSEPPSSLNRERPHFGKQFLDEFSVVQFHVYDWFLALFLVVFGGGVCF